MIDINVLGYDKNTALLDKQLELFFQELGMIFDKKVTDFYGQPNILNLRKFLFSRYISENQVRAEIKDYVIRNCYHQQYFSWDVDVNYLKTDTNRELLYIHFKVKSNGEVYSNEYVIGSTS